MWVLIDNYDSFTHILADYFYQLGKPCTIFMNDAISIAELMQLQPERIILSPGPETPLQAGITLEVIRHYHQHTPILGVCLGHQALGMFYGAQLTHAPQPIHGKIHEIQFIEDPLFHAISQPMTVMRYHSLCVNNLPDTLLPLAHSQDGVIQAFKHRQYPSYGVQFHPESIGTKFGLQLLSNWVNMVF